MNTKIILRVFAAMLGITLAGCNVNDPIYDTAHPGHGQITLTTDWSGIGTGITPAASYTIKVGDYSATLSGNTNTIKNLFVPGTHHANVYNTAEKITLTGTTATVASVTTPTGESGTFIDPLPGWLFTWAGDQTIEKDKDYTLTALMQQQVRELNLFIEPTGGTVSRITSVTATLGGVASQLDMDNGAVSAAASVAPVFTKITSGADAGKYKATVRLLGITGAEQNLKVTLAFTGGSPANLTVTANISAPLTGFNADKKTPLTLGATVVETQTEAGFTCTINDWVKEDRGGTAH